MQLEVIVPKIQRQTGSKDCGLFAAAAAATAIAAGQDPVYLTWNQSQMRNHFKKCIETETVTPFPSKALGLRTGKFPKPNRYTIGRSAIATYQNLHLLILMEMEERI